VEKIHALVLQKIADYKPKGDLDGSAKFFLNLCKVKHPDVRNHVERVSLLSEAVAKRFGKDAKAAFFAGLLHDVGKLLLPYSLFDGHNISAEEYDLVKKHAMDGFLAIKDMHHFTALCAGLHHSLSQKGYGLTTADFPLSWSPATIKKVLEISTFVSVADFIDAFTHRTTKIKDGSDSKTSDLAGMLKGKYPDDHLAIDVALEENQVILALE
jgi:hypothetical protein